MYNAHGITASKDELVTRHAALVQRIAHHLVGRLPSCVQIDDLIQAGMIGLLDAAAHYDESQGAAFETYATIRIRGAMIDELRRNDWVPKSVHRRARELAEAIREVEAETGASAEDADVAERLGVPLDEYYRILQEANAGRVLSFDDLGTDETPAGDLFPDHGATPDEQFQEQRFQSHLSEAIAGLPEREQLVMALYYDRGLNLREIGAVLDVGESRVSQIMSKAHGRLRARLGDWKDSP